MTMRLYRVAPLPKSELFIVAPNTTKAIEMFVANSGLGDARSKKFVVEQIDLKLTGDQRANLDDLLDLGVAGLARYSEVVGWSVEP